MADQLLTLTVKVNSDTGQLDVVSQRMKALSSESEKAGKGLSTAGAGFSSLSKALGGLATGAAIGAFFKSAVQGAEEENQALRRLKFAVEATGQSFSANQKQINEWAQGIQSLTRFTDGQAIETMGKFVRVTGDTVKAQKASQLAMSLSVATGKELGITTELLTNLINKNERGVMMARKEFGAFIGGAANGQQVLDVLSAKFGDAATQEEGFSKSTATLSNNWGELKDSVGNAVIPLLTTLTGWLTKGVDGVRALGDVVAANAAIIFTTVEGIGNAIKSLIQRDFGAIGDIAKETWERIKTITFESEEMVRQEFDKTTVAHAVHSDVRVQQTTARTEAEIQAEKKLTDERQAEAERAIAMAENIEQKILSLSQDTHKGKLALLNAETAAEKRKIDKEISDTKVKENLLAQLDKLHFARVAALTKAEMEMKREAAFKVVEDTLSTLSIINDMQSSHTKAQVTRARLLLALEKAIAIARLWAAESSKGIVGVGIAAAGTALIVAQFAQQSKAIGDAAKTANADNGFSELRQSIDIGNGSTLTDVTTSGAVGQSGGVGSGSGSSSIGGGGVGGGGGTGTIINVGPVTVNFSAGSVDPTNIRQIANQLGDAVQRGIIEATQMSISIVRSGNKQEGLAR